MFLSCGEFYRVRGQQTPVLRAVLLTAIATSGAAQAPIEPVTLRRCAECRIDVSLQTTLGSSDGPGWVGPVFTVRELPDGRFVLSYDAASDEMLVFSGDGSFIRTLGRAGSGPGEFRWIRWVRTAGDGIYAFDPRQRRVTRFGVDLRYESSTALSISALGDMLVRSDSVFVVNGLIRTTDRMGYLVHVFDRAGKVVASMAEEPGGFRPDIEDFVYRRPLAWARNGGIWAAARTRYKIEEWDLGGTLRRTLVRQVPWFKDHLESPRPRAGQLPKPYIEAIRQDARGFLWVLITVADERSNRVVHQGRGGEQALTIADPNRYFDSVVELVDPQTRAVIATTRVDEWLTEFVAEDKVASYAEANDGTPRIKIWRLVVRVPH